MWKEIIKEYIKEYFTDPDNCGSKSIFSLSEWESYSPMEFYLSPESIQEKTSIIMEHIKCEDGFTMSVQASWGHYCEPRCTFRSLDNMIYKSMEVWYPSEYEELLQPYKADESVYWQVPIEVLDKIIDEHWGLKIK